MTALSTFVLHSSTPPFKREEKALWSPTSVKTQGIKQQLNLLKREISVSEQKATLYLCWGDNGKEDPMYIKLGAADLNNASLQKSIVKSFLDTSF